MDLWLDVTSECNERCSYCLRGNDYPRSGEEPLTTDEMIGIIYQNRYIHQQSETYRGPISWDEPLEGVHLSGGEPLIDKATRERVYKIADYCRNRDIDVVLYTNGVAFLSNPELFDEVYKHLDFVQIGVHNYSNLEEIYKLMEKKEQINGDLTIDFIINEKNKAYIPNIIEYLKKTGIKHLTENKISIKFMDMMPLGNSQNIALPKDSTVMSELEREIIGIMKSEHIHRASMSNINESLRDYLLYVNKIIPVDNYGNMRFSTACYGPVFGNLRDNGDTTQILMNRRKYLDALEIYEYYSIPSMKAKELAQEKNVDYEKFYRVYPAYVLNDLFDEYREPDDLDRMVSDFEDMLSETNRLRDFGGVYGEDYYDLELWQKRAFQEVIDCNFEDLSNPKSDTKSLLNKLPRSLVDRIKIDKL